MTDEKARSLAPNYDVPPYCSPFVPLPLLWLCYECGQPVDPLNAYTARRGDHAHEPLCRDCCYRVFPPETPVERCRRLHQLEPGYVMGCDECEQALPPDERSGALAVGYLVFAGFAWRSITRAINEW